MRVGRSAEPNAVFEVYFPYAPIAAGIARDTRMLAALLALGLLVLWISIFRLVAGSLAEAHAAGQGGRPDGSSEPRGAARRRRRALRSSQRSGTLNALLLIDLDRFKEVNDTLGHDQGDMLLCEVAERLGEVLRPSDTLARLGGDEFAILLRDLPHRGAIAEVTTRIRAALERPFELCGVAVELGASIGVALHPDHGSDLTTLLRRADVAMYEAKTRRDDVCTYEPSRDPYSPERLALVGELRRALQRDELLLHFQPKIAIGSGELAGVEALIRWNHPERGLIPPVEFVPLAERTGMIGAVTDWVLASALGTVRALERGRARAPGRRSTSPAPTCSTRASPSAIDSALQTAGLPGGCCSARSPRTPCSPTRSARSRASAACARWACSSRWTTSARGSPR